MLFGEMWILVIIDLFQMDDFFIHFSLQKMIAEGASCIFFFLLLHFGVDSVELLNKKMFSIHEDTPSHSSVQPVSLSNRVLNFYTKPSSCALHKADAKLVCSCLSFFLSGQLSLYYLRKTVSKHTFPCTLDHFGFKIFCRNQE